MGNASPYFPLMLDIANRKVLVVGGGAVAERKVQLLLDTGCRITVLAPDLTAGLVELAAHGRLVHLRQEYSAECLEGSVLVFAAANERGVNAAVAADCRQRGMPVNVADQPGDCSFIVPAVVRRGKLVIAVSTSGASPAWARRIRQRLEQEFGEEYALLLEKVGEARGGLMRQILDAQRRRELLSALAADTLLEVARTGNARALEEAIARFVGRAGGGG